MRSGSGHVTTRTNNGDLLMPRLLAVHAPVHATVHVPEAGEAAPH